MPFGKVGLGSQFRRTKIGAVNPDRLSLSIERWANLFQPLAFFYFSSLFLSLLSFSLLSRVPRANGTLQVEIPARIFHSFDSI